MCVNDRRTGHALGQHMVEREQCGQVRVDSDQLMLGAAQLRSEA